MRHDVRESGGPAQGENLGSSRASCPVGFSPDGGFSPRAAFKWAWTVYRSDLEGVVLPIVLGILAPLLVASVVHGVGSFVLGTVVFGPEQNPPWGVVAIVMVLGLLIDLLAWAFTFSALLPFLLNVARGRPVGLRDVFVPQVSYRRMLAFLAIFGIPTALGIALWVVPGIFLGAVGLCFLPLVVDREESALSLVPTIQRLARDNLIPICGFGLGSVALMVAGLLACGVGVVLVSMPLIALGGTYAYLRLIGEEPVAIDS
jgi:uncharacterized membrane protein